MPLALILFTVALGWSTETAPAYVLEYPGVAFGVLPAEMTSPVEGELSDSSGAVQSPPNSSGTEFRIYYWSEELDPGTRKGDWLVERLSTVLPPDVLPNLLLGEPDGEHGLPLQGDIVHRPCPDGELQPDQRERCGHRPREGCGDVPQRLFGTHLHAGTRGSDDERQGHTGRGDLGDVPRDGLAAADAVTVEQASHGERERGMCQKHDGGTHVVRCPQAHDHRPAHRWNDPCQKTLQRRLGRPFRTRRGPGPPSRAGRRP